MPAWAYRVVSRRLDARTVRVELAEPSGRVLTRGDLVERLVDDRELRATLASAVAAAPFDAVFLECPPIRWATLARPLALVLVDAPGLAGLRADPRAFADRLGDDGEVVRFTNLGGDAELVAPSPPPDGTTEHHAHLAAFVRHAGPPRVDALWRAVGDGLALRVASLPDAPTWLSTSGLGVAWLHVRLDTSPKYYVHAPFRSPDA